MNEEKQILEQAFVNNEKILKENLTKTKPCHLCGYCPYGYMVEMFPLNQEGKINCRVFGHHCPMFYNAEDLSDFGERRINEEKSEGEK